MEEGRKEARPSSGFLVMTEYVCGCGYRENRMVPIGKRTLWPHKCGLVEGRLRI
jgi:hypothetical protein